MNALTLRTPLSVWSNDAEGARDVHIANGVIREQAAAAAQSLDVSGCIVTPGLVNAHHHLLQSGFRTLNGTRGVAMRDWLPAMAAAYADAGIDATLAYAAARVGIAEGLLSGVTTIADHQLNWPRSGEDGAEIAGAVDRASRELGSRLVFVRGTAGDDPADAVSSADSIAAALAPRMGGVSADGMTQVAVGPAGVHSDSRATFEALGEVAARRGCAAARRPTNRSIPRSRSGATGGVPSNCSTSGGGSHRM